MTSSLPCGPRRSVGPVSRLLMLCLAVAIAGASGCGAAPEDRAGPSSAVVSSNQKQLGLAMANYEATGTQGEGKAQTPAVVRKIIYDARIDLVVESLGGLEASILDLVKQNGGFLAESDLATQVSTQRTATWRVRVPVDHFDAFIRAVGRLGEVRTSHLGSQDVTEEYFDIEARIRNKQEEEKRLLKHLADSTGKLEDILKVEAELSRVRGEVEQMQGRLRFLADRADLSTVTITATELKDYRPPAPVTLSAQISTTFFRSLDALIAFGEAVLLLLVALVPWIPLLVLGLLLALWIHRLSSRADAGRMRGIASGGPEKS